MNLKSNNIFYSTFKTNESYRNLKKTKTKKYIISHFYISVSPLYISFPL